MGWVTGPCQAALELETIRNADPAFMYNANTLFIVYVCFDFFLNIALKYYLSWLLDVFFVCPPTLKFCTQGECHNLLTCLPSLQPYSPRAPLSLSLCLFFSMIPACGFCTWQPQNIWTSYIVGKGSQTKCPREASGPAPFLIWFSLGSQFVQLLLYFIYHGNHKCLPHTGSLTQGIAKNL